MLERVKSFAQQFRTQFSSFYGGLTRGRKIALLAGFLSVLLMMLAVAFWRPSKEYVVAYNNLTQEDKTAILGHLKKSNVKDYVQEGDSISFREDQILDLKMQLAQEGLPSSGTGIGWEKFDERNFGLTDFDQKINKIRAIQGELARTINRLDSIDSSRVHIVAPDQSVFTEDKKPTTASIFIRTKQGQSLSKKQIQGIVNLVARAVEGLDPNQVAIVDQFGNMLTKVETKDGGLEDLTGSQQKFKSGVEQDLEVKIKQILERVVGQNKVIAKVFADIDFTQVERTIQDVDPERTVIKSQERKDQSTNGFGLNPTGVPGAKSNLPGEKSDSSQGGGSGTTSTGNQELVNYDFKKSLSKIVEPIGNIKKVSASVLVDAKMVDGKPAERTAEEMDKITKLVRNAIGFQENRDALTVEWTAFEPDEFVNAEKSTIQAKTVSLVQTGVIALVAIAGTLFLYFGLVRPYFRWLTFDPNKRSQEEVGIVEYELERTGEAAKRVQVAEDVPFEKLPPKEQIMFLAKNDPKKTTEAIRQLLSPSHGG